MTSLSRAPSFGSPKQHLPHVSSLIQSAEIRNATFDARKTLSSQRTRTQRSTPSSPTFECTDLRSTPNIHLLASIPDLYPQPIVPVSTPHRRRKSSGMPSPSSKAASITEGSIFELPTPMQLESPNSSIAVSFVAELEDTSGQNNEASQNLPGKSEFVPHNNTSVLFKTNKFTSQAVLKIVDETIASIEAANRELLARAEAAEASAYRLHVSNTELRERVEMLTESKRSNFSPLMQSFGTQTSPRTSPEHSPRSSIGKNTRVVFTERGVQTTSRIISRSSSSKSFDRGRVMSTPALQTAQVVQMVTIPKFTAPSSHPKYPPPPPPEPQEELPEVRNAKFRRSIRSLKFLQRSHADNSSESFTPNSKSNKTPRQSADRPRTADATSPTVASSHFNRLTGAPPLPELPTFLSLTAGDNILTNSQKGNEGNRPRKHTRTVSFEEAKKIAAKMDAVQKLPVSDPPGEISPSPIHGVVEIGLGAPDGEKDTYGNSTPLRSQRSRVRFLLKENSIKEYLKEKDRKESKKHGWLKWTKKGDQVVVA